MRNSTMRHSMNIDSALARCHSIALGANPVFMLLESVNVKDRELHHFRLADESCMVSYVAFDIRMDEMDTEALFKRAIAMARKEVFFRLMGSQHMDTEFRTLKHLLGVLDDKLAELDISLAEEDMQLKGVSQTVEDGVHPAEPAVDNAAEKVTFTFSVNMDIKIEAPDLSSAVIRFQKEYPEAFIDRIRDEHGPMGHTYSSKAHDAIWYVPGCPFGECDCVLDPMYDVAEECASQSELTPDKYQECIHPGPDDEECDSYDDEDK